MIHIQFGGISQRRWTATSFETTSRIASTVFRVLSPFGAFHRRIPQHGWFIVEKTMKNGWYLGFPKSWGTPSSHLYAYGIFMDFSILKFINHPASSGYLHDGGKLMNTFTHQVSLVLPSTSKFSQHVDLAVATCRPRHEAVSFEPPTPSTHRKKLVGVKM